MPEGRSDEERELAQPRALRVHELRTHIRPPALVDGVPAIAPDLEPILHFVRRTACVNSVANRADRVDKVSGIGAAV